MFHPHDSAFKEGKVIHIRSLAPRKPADGEPFNGCGVCCLAAPCPLGILLSRRWRGACAALSWDQTPGLYRCGALTQPRQVLQQALPHWLHFLAGPLSAGLARLCRRWIAAGRGCDGQLEVRPVTDIADNEPTYRNPMTDRQQLLSAFDALLQPERFKDYGPNGLQVEGHAQVHKIVSGVTASRALIEAAIAARADAIFVHHGLFWRGQDGRVTGWMKQRLALLLAHDINLLAYHLPLDAHRELGNNAQLGWKLGLKAHATFGEQDLGFLGTRTTGDDFVDAVALSEHVELVLKHPVTLISTGVKVIKNIAWCSGGAQSYFEAAIAAGADAFITGEISEPQAHYARESGVAYLACGHHATERYGAPAVAAHIAAQLGLTHEFIDIDNPA